MTTNDGLRNEALRQSGKAETPATDKAVDATGQTASDLNALRVRVAELCGWERDTLYGTHWVHPLTKLLWKHLPNYPSDLNACAEGFENGLTDGQLYDYIWKLVGKHWFDTWDFSDVLKLARATAEQRCRAFVATMEGKEK